MWLHTRIGRFSKRARKYKRQRYVVYSCDKCGVQFELAWREKRSYGSNHFCSTDCSRGGAWTEERRAFQKQHCSRIARASWARPEFRERIVEAVRQSHADEELEEQRIASMKKTMATPEFKAKRSALSKAAYPKTLETNRRMGNVRESRAEREFVAWLRSVLGEEDVVHHPHHVNGFDIDVYINSLDVYVQFDGVYYHGLDRPYEQLTPIIKRKFDRDRSADKHFPALGLQLVRITDKHWATLGSEELKREWLTSIASAASRAA